MDMRYYTIAPPPILAPYVRFYWVLEGSVHTAEPYVHRSMADGCAELLFHYKGRFQELYRNGGEAPSFISGIHGQSQHYSRFRIHEDFGMFGAYLYPFALQILLGIPAAEFSNRMTSLCELPGKEGTELEERIMLAPDNNERARILSLYLSKKCTGLQHKQPGVFQAIQHIIHSGGQSRTEALASDYCLSARQFQRSFKQQAGFSPKLFSRIVRFQSALATRNKSTYKSLGEMALACGYYDQSHFIHDFREFSGHHPRHYFHGEAEGTEWQV